MKQESHVISIPPELRHPFFFEVDEIEWEGTNNDILFYEEISFYNQLQAAEKPWLNPKKNLQKLIDKWNLLRDEIAEMFKNRKQKEASQMMKKGISYFFQYLYWTNGQPARMTNIEQLKDLEVHPVNVVERLQFIMNRPRLHHSYIQLDELFTEQQKHFMKKMIMKKPSQP